MLNIELYVKVSFTTQTVFPPSQRSLFQDTYSPRRKARSRTSRQPDGSAHDGERDVSAYGIRELDLPRLASVGGGVRRAICRLAKRSGRVHRPAVGQASCVTAVQLVNNMGRRDGIY